MPSDQSKILSHPAALCNMLKRVAVEAGIVTLDYFEGIEDMGLEEKDDGSPVTAADQAAEKVIEKALKGIAPEVPMIGEESVEDGIIPNIDGAEFFWLVDPLDGTKEFISGSGEYTVNIALIHNGVPTVGVVYAPVKGELYAGSGPGTAVRYLEETRTEKPICVREIPTRGMTVVASKNHANDEKLGVFLKNYKVDKVLKRGSSLKICAVAAGKADIYPRFGPTCEWDTAAGDAVLRSAGGFVIDLDGNPFRYGHSERKFLNPEFIACPQEFELPESVADIA